MGTEEIVFCDFEYKQDPGERPEIHCLVAYEHFSGKKYRLWVDELGDSPPYACTDDTLFVAFVNSAEFSCYHQLNWPLPKLTIDLHAEHRVLTNQEPPLKNRGSLLDALEHHKLPGISAALKEERRDLAIRGGPFTGKEKKELLEYCETDVIALCRLYEKMENKIDWQRALFRGEYMKCVSLIEHWGIPIDVEKFSKLRGNWDQVEERLIESVNEKYQVFEGRTFKLKLFEEWLARQNISWPKTPTGRPKTDEATFKDMSKTYPQVIALKEVNLSDQRSEHLEKVASRAI